MRKRWLNQAAWGSLIALMVGASCATPGRKTATGAAVGGGAGAVIGGVAGGAKGAGIGAVAGGAAGAILGNYLERRQEELAKVVPTVKTDEGLKINLKNDLLFGFDQAELQADARSRLDRLAEILKKYPDDQLLVAGYTDDVGSTAYNQRLSSERAKAVRDFLVSQGVDAGRIRAVGRGESEAKGRTETARQADRRVNILIDVPEEKIVREAEEARAE